MTKKKNAFFGVWFFYYAIAIGFAMVCPLVLKAQSDTAKTKLLNEVQIKAKRFNLLQASPTPVQKLSGDELKRINSFLLLMRYVIFLGCS